MGCTRNGNWGDPCEVAVLVNPLVRSNLNINTDQQVQLHVAYAINTALDDKAKKNKKKETSSNKQLHQKRQLGRSVRRCRSGELFR